MDNKTHDTLSAFKKDVQTGLSSSRKYIPSKYFYDEKGCELFNQITRHSDYYLTQSEVEILNANKKTLSNLFRTEAFNLVELGPGEGLKTQILIKQFLQDALQFTYLPIDISLNYLNTLTAQFHIQLPDLKLKPLHSDYFQGLEWLNLTSEKRNVVLFFGSSIGNFSPDENLTFLQHTSDILHPKDYILIGFDLRKDIDILRRAYNDSAGITRQFNLNLFQRMNRELSANFDVEKFQHYETYNVYSGAMESYLISLEEQVVNIDALSNTFTLQSYEPIHVEYSYKYLRPQIEWLAKMTGFEVVHTFTDSKQYFIDSLWRKV
jgi:L-histidine Nalpha-methyltransferase